MIWFVADSHFHHTNIVWGLSNWDDKSGCRPFDEHWQHDDWLVDLINDRVMAQDTLWHLGDWSFGGKDRVKEFRDRLHCANIHLVLGNHDHHIAKDPTGFESVQSYKELALPNLNVILCHYPIESWNLMERGSKHLHGHVHGNGAKICGRIDVGIDARGLMSVEDVIKEPTATSQRHSTIEGGNKFG